MFGSRYFSSHYFGLHYFSEGGDGTGVSDEFKKAVYAQESSEVFIALLTFTSPELPEPIYVASDPYQDLPIGGVKGVVSNGQEFVFLPFDITLPRDDKTGTVSAQLKIENSDRQIIGTIRSIKKAVTVKIQCVLIRDVNLIELQFDNFQLTNVTYDSMYITGDLSLDYWGLEPFPSGRFTKAGFPGMF